MVEDHPIFRHGVIQLLNAEPDLQVCGTAGSGPEALGALRKEAAELVILDISLQGANGIELTKQLRAEHPDMHILVLSMHDESTYALRSLRAGAQGYVSKSEGNEALLTAVRCVLEGRIHVSPAFGSQILYRVVKGSGTGAGNPVDDLTDRELEVLQLIGNGQRSVDIASNLHLSIKTIESHRLHIKEKLGLRNSAELVRFATGWVEEKNSGPVNAGLS